MNPGRIDIQGKLPRGAIEMYLQIDACAQQEDIRFLVVGAFARELILVHGFDAKYARATKDLDFGIQLKTWEAFHQLKSRLKDFGFQSHPTIHHRMLFTDSDNTEWIMDLLPFGDLTENDQELLWPPEGDVRMSTHGFSEAMESAWQVRINDQPGV